MKLFLIGSLLLSGGSVAAIQNEEVREGVTDVYQNVRARVANRVKENAFDRLRENGFPYPSEERLATLTEEEQVAIITAIDQVNATYDFTNMTDEEIEAALLLIQEELNLVAEELGFDLPEDWMQARFNRRVNRKTKEVLQDRVLEDLRENGIEYPSEERLANLTEEQQTLLLAKIDELNATYDWANMTDEEIMDAMEVLKVEFESLREELGLPMKGERGNRSGKRGTHNEEPVEDVVEGSDDV